MFHKTKEKANRFYRDFFLPYEILRKKYDYQMANKIVRIVFSYQSNHPNVFFDGRTRRAGKNIKVRILCGSGEIFFLISSYVATKS